MNMTSTNEVTTSSHIGTSHPSCVNTNGMNYSKVESVISKLVERKTRANSNQSNNSSVVDSRRMTTEDNEMSGNDFESDNSADSLPQNLVLNRDNRDKRTSDLKLGSGYRVP